VLDDMNEQTGKPVDEFLPRISLSIETASQQAAIDFRQSHDDT
jgi:hypothetical protein